MKVEESTSANFKILALTELDNALTPSQLLAILEEQRSLQVDYDLAGVDVPGTKYIYLIYQKRNRP
jgi:hypothetical protein